MIEGIDINQRIEFSFEDDAGDPKTIFVFRPLSSAEMMDWTIDNNGNQIKLAGSKLFDYLASCIVEIKNYPFPQATILETLKTIKMPRLTILIQKSSSINDLKAEDQKN